MSRQVTIQTKLREESIVCKVLEEEIKAPYYFRQLGSQRKMVVETSLGPLEFVVTEEGFQVTQEEEQLKRFQPWIHRLQQLYSLEWIKQTAQKAGYSIDRVQHENQQITIEVSSW